MCREFHDRPQEGRELSARLDAERSAARSALVPVQREEWWTRAQPQDIAPAEEGRADPGVARPLRDFA